MKNKNSSAKKSGKLFWLVILFIILFAITVWTVYPLIQPSGSNNHTITFDKINTKNDNDSAFLKAATSDQDSNVRLIRVSNPEDLNVPYDVDNKAGNNIRRVYNGRRINIAVIGVDSRLGSGCKHADANHVISILIDQGKIEITSIPRDTHADVGFDDTTGQNKLTILYAVKGRKAYLEEAAKIAELDRIHYWVEVGFSQAMGILELLGFKNSGSTLQVLRSRTGLGGDDYQRSYNQGQFIRQTILKHFDKFTGLWGEVLIRGGLALLETNMTISNVKHIVNNLKGKGFPNNMDDFGIRVRPPLPMHFKIYDFTDKAVVSSLSNKIERFNEHNKPDSTDVTENNMVNVGRRLTYAINLSIQDSAKRPQQVISHLLTYYNQRAWYQVKNPAQRYKIREQIGILLSDAYKKRKKYDEASAVLRVVEAERKLFDYPIFENK